MRDIALICCIVGALGATIRYPYVGVMFWVWMSIQNPHQETYSFVHRIPLVFIVAVAATISWTISTERKVPPRGVMTPLVLTLLAWTTFNGFFAFDPTFSWPFWGRAWKTIAMCVVAATLATNKVRIQAMIWVVALSLGYYGVKGGIFTLVSGGASHVFGPPDSMIRENNELALALVMLLPMLHYLRVHSGARSVRAGLLGAIILCVTSVLGSYSRGGYIALTAVAFAFWLRAKNKLAYPAAAVIVLIPLLKFMPESFYNRVYSIQQYNTDETFQSRLASWSVAYHYAVDHFPFGAGFYGINLRAIWDKYHPGEVFAAHSIYFQTLGEQGFVGLALYLAIILFGFLNLRATIRDTKGIPALAWAHDLARMMQLSLVAFCVGGAAAPMNFYDVFFLWMMLSATLHEQTKLQRAASARIAPERMVISGAPR